MVIGSFVLAGFLWHCSGTASLLPGGGESPLQPPSAVPCYCWAGLGIPAPRCSPPAQWQVALSPLWDGEHPDVPNCHHPGEEKTVPWLLPAGYGSVGFPEISVTPQWWWWEYQGTPWVLWGWNHRLPSWPLLVWLWVGPQFSFFSGVWLE